MAKRSITTKEDTNISTALVVGREYFKDELNKRIVIGEEIYARQIQTNRQFDQARQDYYDWNDFNAEFLKQSFNKPSNEYKESYDAVNEKYIYNSRLHLPSIRGDLTD